MTAKTTTAKSKPTLPYANKQTGKPIFPVFPKSIGEKKVLKFSPIALTKTKVATVAKK